MEEGARPLNIIMAPFDQQTYDCLTHLVEVSGSSCSICESKVENIDQIDFSSIDLLLIPNKLLDKVNNRIPYLLRDNERLCIGGVGLNSTSDINAMSCLRSGVSFILPDLRDIERGKILFTKSLHRIASFRRATTLVHMFWSEQLSSENIKFPVVSALKRSGRLVSPQDKSFSLALQEAITNAVEHGNLELESSLKEEFNIKDGRDSFTIKKQERLNDPTFRNLSVFISIELLPNKIVVTIVNEGPGFDYKSQLSKSSSIGIDSFYGRGLSMIQRACDDFSFSDSGRMLSLIKNLENVSTTFKNELFNSFISSQ